MKKKVLKILVSLFTVSIMILQIIPTSVFATSDKENTADLQQFIDDTLKLTSYEPEPLVTMDSVDENDEKINIDFSSCRLILKSKKKPEKLNSVGMASGFKDYYIIQFKNESDTEKAYTYYSDVDYITDVGTDEAMGVLDFSDNIESNGKVQPNVTADSLNSWGAEFMGLYTLKNYYSANNIALPKIKVAVVDSGIDFNHEYFKDKQNRLEHTNFSTQDDNTNSEQDDENGHGTAVTSTILDATPNNVIVRNYKILHSEEAVPVSAIFPAILQAVCDKVNIINCSFHYSTSNKEEVTYQIFNDALKEAYDNNITVFCAAGNWANTALDYESFLPVSSEYTIAVSAVKKDTLIPTFGRGKYVDVYAPGTELPFAYIGGYIIGDGTSFSSPLTASVATYMVALHPEYTVETVRDKLKETCTPFFESFGINKIKNVFPSGIVDALDATGFKRPNTVVASHESGKYEDKIIVSLSSPDNLKIYYTINETFPTKDDAILYDSSKPIEIYSNQILLNAVAYDENGVAGKLMSHLYRSSILEDEKNFKINDEGSITEYSGNLEDLIIPDKINGTTVTNIECEAFENKPVSGITLPNTIKNLSEFAFLKHQTLMFIDGEAVESIGYECFRECKRLAIVNFPNVKTIGDMCFYDNMYVADYTFPKVTYIGEQVFSCVQTLNICLPELTKCGRAAFAHSFTHYLYVPKLSTIEDVNYSYLVGSTRIIKAVDFGNLEEVGEKFFVHGDAKTNKTCLRAEFSKLKKLPDFPDIKSSLVLPSTVSEMPKTLNDKYTSTYGNTDLYNLYTIYGSSGTYVEKRAKELGAKFIEITPETAIINDLPKFFKPYMINLEADVVGFNRQYQWYANTKNSNEGGTPINGANEKFFDPATYYAPYYYCVVTSTDVGYEPITIRTSACENRMFEKNVTDISRNTERNGYTVKVKGNPDKIQFVSSNGSTRTYNRNNLFVAEVNAFDTNNNPTTDKANTAYEKWTIAVNLPVDDYTVIAKYGKAWDIAGYDFNPKDKEDCRFISAEASGEKGEKTITVKTGVDVIKIQLSEPERNYCATINYGYVDKDGIRTWTFKRAFALGSHDMDILIKTKDGWTDGGKVQFESAR